MLKQLSKVLLAIVILAGFIFIYRSECSKHDDLMSYLITANESLFSNDNLRFEKDTFCLSINQKDVLLYRHFTGSCSKCLIDDINNIKYMQKLNKGIDIYIFINEPKTKKGKIMLQRILEGVNFKYVRDSKYKFFPRQQQRYFAIISSNGSISNIFFPIYRYHNANRQYINRIIDLLGEHNK